jgi:hypothetical protein
MAGIFGIKWAKNKKQSKDKLERLKLSEIWEILTDKRFGFRFRIANIICRDYLRLHILTGNHRVRNCIDILEHPYYSNEVKLKHIERNLRRANKALEDVFDF